MKTELCAAFCDDIHVSKVPMGLAVSTIFKRGDGDKVSFYVTDLGNGTYTIEDDGLTIPFLEGEGVDFETPTRQEAFEQLLGGIGADFDTENSLIKTSPVSKHELPSKALEFVSTLIRLEDFLLLTKEKVASTFKEDASRKIRDSIGGKATIRENEPVSNELSETIPDMIIEAQSRVPVVVFFVNTPNRINDAVILQMIALHEAKKNVSVVALLENERSATKAERTRAANRLATVPIFENDEDAAIQRITREALGIQLNG